MQIQPTGVVSRVCLMMHYNTDSFPFGHHQVVSDHWDLTAALVMLDSMLKQLDQLCESLGDTLHEVVIAFFHPKDDSDTDTRPDLVRTMRRLRCQMPGMASRQCLAFRMSRKHPNDFFQNGDTAYKKVAESVFKHDGEYWTDFVLDDHQSSEPGSLSSPLSPEGVIQFILCYAHSLIKMCRRSRGSSTSSACQYPA